MDQDVESVLSLSHSHTPFHLSFPSPLSIESSSLDAVSSITLDVETDNLVAGFSNGTIAISSLSFPHSAPDTLLPLSSSHTSPILWSSFLDSYMFLASTSSSLSLYSVEELSPISNITFPFPSTNCCLHPSSPSVLSIGTSSNICTIDLRTGVPSSFTNLTDPRRSSLQVYPYSACFLDDSYVLVGDSLNRVVFIDTRFSRISGRLNFKNFNLSAPVTSLLACQEIYCLDSNGVLSIFNSGNFSLISQDAFDCSLLTSVTLDSNNILVSKSGANLVTIERGNLGSILTGHIDDVTCLAGGDGIIVSGDKGGFCLVWRIGYC
ncbi:hypothetical protein P9112_009729 [Eukaryota sp. TZLM1-RC]